MKSLQLILFFRQFFSDQFGFCVESRNCTYKRSFNELIFTVTTRRRYLKINPLQVRHKQDWDRGFILLLPKAAELPESDAGSDVIKPELSSKTVRPRAPCGD